MRLRKTCGLSLFIVLWAACSTGGGINQGEERVVPLVGCVWEGEGIACEGVCSGGNCIQGQEVAEEEEGAACSDGEGADRGGNCILELELNECEWAEEGAACGNGEGVCIREAGSNTCCILDTEDIFCEKAQAMHPNWVCGWMSAPSNCGTERVVNCGSDACTDGAPYCDNAANQCQEEDPAPFGDTCGEAIRLYLWEEALGDTTNARADYGHALSWDCSRLLANDNANNNVHADGRELVYSYTPAEDGNFRVLVTPAAGTNYNPLLWMTEGEGTCGDGNMCAAAANNGGNGRPEELSVAGVAGTTYYFYVDARNTGNATAGPFSITVTGFMPEEETPLPL